MIQAIDYTSGANGMNTSIQEFIATNGVRRFERGDGGDYGKLQDYLVSKGYRLRKVVNSYVIDQQGKCLVKSMQRKPVIEFIDKLRAADGLETIMPRKAI